MHIRMHQRGSYSVPVELSTGLVAARRVHVAGQMDTLLLSRFLSVMVRWVAPSVHVADSYREAQTCPAEFSTGLVAARHVHVAGQTDTLLLSCFSICHGGMGSPFSTCCRQLHVADKSGRGQGPAGTLPECNFCLYVRLIINGHVRKRGRGERKESGDMTQHR